MDESNEFVNNGRRRPKGRFGDGQSNRVVHRQQELVFDRVADAAVTVSNLSQSSITVLNSSRSMYWSVGKWL